MSPLRLFLVLLVPSLFAASDLFPKMAAAAEVQVVDGRRDDLNARLSLQALQGLINQQSASVYLLTDQHHEEQLGLAEKPRGNRLRTRPESCP